MSNIMFNRLITFLVFGVYLSALSVMAAPHGFGAGNSNFGGGGGFGTGATGATGAKAGTNNAATKNTGNNNAAAANGDPQTSLTLDNRVIATGFKLDGNQVPAAGQSASLTSSNNFINFCLTSNLPITNGKQIETGSCNPAPIGMIPQKGRMPRSKFTSPKNLATVKANTKFTVTMAITNMQTGVFVNAAANYFAAPQQLTADGAIIGHSHFVIEKIDSIDSVALTDPTKFAFFKGINTAAKNGILSADVTDGLPEGVYRLASINSSSNHQPIIVPVAQHGALDDMVYFTVTKTGK
ncbi:hypothetical protein CYLTODRAFT_413777 [Cylindrobasidium torrendii FP15055 ss-10]|uniref:Lytic polysaccharide monooxygenase n=1 Tax=Cylindrobasidium torrendii FP15055 ss-10 TaxID=1314674 RepID=A0A0D7B0S4_9AGAR|nr:hypothetical protein CYLTODRAFT_413777 [Cylindrobasidium torrendii FP15055 ss-10]